jgi:HD-GYP domain-containing protein (c-di-GMP phosphodiesterase class II)
MLGALLHDVGKLTLDVNVIEAGRKLSPEEFEEVKEHPVAGYKLLSVNKDPEVRRTALTALRHHVKKNNKGYPLGIPFNKLRTIDLMVQFCDILSALLVQRQYKEVVPPMQALRITCDELMKHGSPSVTESCARVIQEGLVGAVVQMRDDSYGKIISIENMCPVGITVIKLKSGKEVVGDGTLETEPFRILGR